MSIFGFFVCTLPYAVCLLFLWHSCTRTHIRARFGALSFALALKFAGATGFACSPRRCECANNFTRCKKRTQPSLVEHCGEFNIQAQVKRARARAYLALTLTHTYTHLLLTTVVRGASCFLFSRSFLYLGRCSVTARALRSNFKRVLMTQAAILCSACHLP